MWVPGFNADFGAAICNSNDPVFVDHYEVELLVAPVPPGRFVQQSDLLVASYPGYTKVSHNLSSVAPVARGLAGVFSSVGYVLPDAVFSEPTGGPTVLATGFLLRYVFSDMSLGLIGAMDFAQPVELPVGVSSCRIQGIFLGVGCPSYYADTVGP